jgi:hypothetical protein
MSGGAALGMYGAGLEHLPPHDSLTALMEWIVINDTDVKIHLFCSLKNQRIDVKPLT